MSKYRIDEPGEYIGYLENWLDHLHAGHISEIAKNPAACAVISVDMIKGFCSIGPLASPRVKAIIQPIVELLNLTWGHGIRSIVFLQDTHEPDAVEFGSFPPHCMRGTEEAETVEEFKSLPFFNQIKIMEKNSISSGLHTGLNTWIADHLEVNTFFVVGDCTDLCTYQLAMHLRLDANARQLQRRVILPVDCVDTYDLTIKDAEKINAVPHPASFVHAVFLHNMLLNGIEIFSSIKK
jgi:nicotinamidase-related amidase